MDAKFWMSDLPILAIICSLAGIVLILVLYGFLGLGRKAPVWEARLMLWLANKLVGRAHRLLEHDKLEQFKDEMALLAGKVRLR